MADATPIVPNNPLFVAGKQTEQTFVITAGAVTMRPSDLPNRTYTLTFPASACVTAFSDRPNRVLEASVQPNAFAALWKTTLPNTFAKDPPDAYVSFARERRRAKCAPARPEATARAGCGGCGCDQCEECTPRPKVLSALVGRVDMNSDRSLTLYAKLTVDAREVPVETRLLGVTVTLRSVFVPPRGTFRLDITTTRSCGIFSDAMTGCNPRSPGTAAVSYNVLFSNDGTTMDFYDPVNTTSGINRFTLTVSWPREGLVALHTTAGATINADAQERYDETGEHKYRVVWVWTFNRANTVGTAPGVLPDFAFSGRWTLSSTATHPCLT